MRGRRARPPPPRHSPGVQESTASRQEVRTLRMRFARNRRRMPLNRQPMGPATPQTPPDPGKGWRELRRRLANRTRGNGAQREHTRPAGCRAGRRGTRRAQARQRETWAGLEPATVGVRRRGSTTESDAKKIENSGNSGTRQPMGPATPQTPPDHGKGWRELRRGLARTGPVATVRSAQTPMRQDSARGDGVRESSGQERDLGGNGTCDSRD